LKKLSKSLAPMSVSEIRVSAKHSPPIYYQLPNCSLGICDFKTAGCVQRPTRV
jgi:hypothetical protein